MLRAAIGTTMGWGVTSLEQLEGAMADARRTLSFLRGRMLFRPRADDIYVATYPRSGTTWMQFMLHQLVRGGGDEFRHINDVCPWFERSLALGTLTPQDLADQPSPRIFKTHLPRPWLPATGRFVVILRDPADVALSYFRLYRSYLGFSGSLDEFLLRFEQGRVQYGSWWDHVAQWHRHADDGDVLLIHYEALREDPVRGLTEVARFCGLPEQPDRIASAVDAARLGRMKAQEVRFDHATSLLIERGVVPREFIGAATVGGSLKQLRADQRARLHQIRAGRPKWGSRWLPGFLH